MKYREGDFRLEMEKMAVALILTHPNHQVVLCLILLAHRQEKSIIMISSLTEFEDGKPTVCPCHVSLPPKLSGEEERSILLGAHLLAMTLCV